MLGPEEIDRLRAESDAQRQDLSAAEVGEGHQRRTASVLRAIEPYYSLATPSTVPLYAGPLLSQPGEGETAEQVEGTISLELTPRPQVLVQRAAHRLLHFQDLLNPLSRLQLLKLPRFDGQDVRQSGAGSVYGGCRRRHHRLETT